MGRWTLCITPLPRYQSYNKKLESYENDTCAECAVTNIRLVYVRQIYKYQYTCWPFVPVSLVFIFTSLVK